MKKVKVEVKASERLSDFLNFCRSVQTEYVSMENALLVDDKSTQDLLHQIELGHWRDRDKTATQLAHLRRERRKHKDYVDTLSYFYSVISRPEVITIMRELEQVLGQVRKKEKEIANQERFYKARVLKDIPICKDQTNEGE